MVKKRKNKKSRKFNVEFLGLRYSDKENRLINNRIDITNMLEKLSKIKVSNRLDTINGEIIRLQDIFKTRHLIIENDIFVMKFIKFKENSIFGVAYENGDYNEDELSEFFESKNGENKKYLASPTICLYDSEKDVFVISRNKDGVSISEILEFLKKKFKNDNLELYPILKNKKITSDMIKNYKNFDISIENAGKLKRKDEENLKKSKCLYSLIDSLKKSGVNNINLHAGVTKEDEGFQENLGLEIFALSTHKIENIKTLKLAVKIPNEKRLNYINFLKDRLTDEFIITLNEGELLKSEYVLNETLDSYSRKYQEISGGK